jgi:hypothetical protein
MKKMVFCIIPLIVVIMGCASSGTPVETTNTPVAATTGNFSGMDLDVAIKVAATQMEENLPGGTKVALVSVASSSAQFSEYVISRLEAAIVSGKRLVVVDPANLDKVRDEQGFQLSGEVDDDSAKAIGKLAGAGAIVTGAFANLGDVYSLTLKAINIETATVAVSYPADITKSTRIETLLASGGGVGTGGTRAAQTLRASDNTTVATTTAIPVVPQIEISKWDLRGKDTSEWFAILVIEKVISNAFGNTFEGYFDWYHLGAPAGRELFNGIYTVSSRKVNIKGTKLENARNLGLGEYEAFLSEDGNNLTRGTWGGSGTASGTWQAIKQTRQ